MADTTYDIQKYINFVKRAPMGGCLASGYPKNTVYWPAKTYGGGNIGGGSNAGVIVQGTVYGGGLIKSRGPLVGPLYSNWIWTSHIGSLNFKHDDTGEVRKFPMLWGGIIYRVERLGSSGVVVYGDNGITFSTRVGTDWTNYKQLLRVGIKGRGAVCVRENDREHFFIDATGFFWRLLEGSEPVNIDYSNYFADLNSNVVMSYDYDEDIIYICDGVKGYVWSEDGLGQGPPNITGIVTRNGTFYCTAPAAITTDPFNICTDIQDFGVRTEKTISQIDMGVALQGDAYGAIDYRWRTNQNFFISPWTKADRNGRIFHRVSGIEFRIRIKLMTWEDIELDYGNIKILYDDFKPLVVEK